MKTLWECVRWKIAVLILIGYCGFLLTYVLWLLQLNDDGYEKDKFLSDYSPGIFMEDTNSKQVFQPWPQDSICSKFGTTFGKNLPLRFLVSFPRSGNTWLRYLIEGATGVFTGTIYEDKELFRLGFLGEIEPRISRRTILIKTHELPIPGSKYVQDDAPTILVIRNPIESLVSFWSFNQKMDHFQENNIESFNSHEFREYVGKQIDHWQRVYESRLLWSDDLLVIFYENLMKNPLNELRRVVKYLGYPLNKERLECLQKYINGAAKRNKTEINPFNTVEKMKLQEAVNTIIYLLKLRGIDDIPDIYYYIVVS